MPKKPVGIPLTDLISIPTAGQTAWPRSDPSDWHRSTRVSRSRHKSEPSQISLVPKSSTGSHGRNGRRSAASAASEIGCSHGSNRDSTRPGLRFHQSQSRRQRACKLHGSSVRLPLRPAVEMTRGARRGGDESRVRMSWSVLKNLRERESAILTVHNEKGRESFRWHRRTRSLFFQAT